MLPDTENNVSVAADWGSAPGLNTANVPVCWSKIAAAGRPASGSNSPAGRVDGGGDTAGAAGVIVGGGAVSGFEEHPAASTASATNTAVDLRKPARFTSFGNG
ncbi:hypothetical protein MSZK_30850 [Mycobacterium sp. shizuoka-1]|nr:hypothetical protein MSZK_30850 [Mycobacterium sp. shizuoka-1]